MSIVYGNKALEKYAREYRKKIVSKVRRIVLNTARLIEDTAKSLAPVDEGQLRQSIETTILSSDGLSAQVLVSAEHGIWVEFGTGIYATGPGGSRAKNIPWHFYSTKLNRWVTMSGIKPQPFWFPAIEEGRRYFESELSKL